MSEPQYAHLKTGIQDGVLVLTVTEPQLRSDELVEKLGQELLAAVTAAGTVQVVLDLSPVQFLSSAGFRPFLSLRRALQDKNGRIVLCGLTPEVADTFRVTRMISTRGSSTALFDTEPTVPAAVALLTGAAPK